MNNFQITGLVAAVHTPFDPKGNLNLNVIEPQAAHLAKNEVHTVFIGGSTGESHSLSFNERIALTEKWVEIAPKFAIKVIVHVGSNCLNDSAQLAAHAQAKGADAIAALAPMYYKPKSVQVLIECCAKIASEAPNLPFFTMIFQC